MSEQETTDQETDSRLRNCKLCGNEISPYSPFCRNCGHPQGSTAALWILLIFLGLFVAIYMGMTLFCLCNVQKFRVYEDDNPRIEQKQNPEEGGRQPQ